MQVPQNQNLHSQSFNSKFIEFVWRFPSTKEEHTQIIFKVFKDGKILLEEGVVDNEGEYKYEYMTSGILSTKNIFYEELSTLKDDVVKYLNEP